MINNALLIILVVEVVVGGLVVGIIQILCILY